MTDDPIRSTAEQPTIADRVTDLLGTFSRYTHSAHFDSSSRYVDCDGMSLHPVGEYVRYDDVATDLDAIVQDLLVTDQQRVRDISRLTMERDDALEKLSKLREMATDLLRQRDEALRGWIEVAEALGCTEDDDSVSGAVRQLKKRAEEAERRVTALRADIQRVGVALATYGHHEEDGHANYGECVRRALFDLQSRELTEERATEIAIQVKAGLDAAMRLAVPNADLPVNVGWLRDQILFARGSR